MRFKKRSICLTILLAMLLSVPPVGARGVELDMKSAVPEDRAIGRVTIKHTGFIWSDRLLTIDVFRLKPNSVYSVWLVDSRYPEKIPAGLRGKNYFKTDGSGNGRYVYYTDEYELGWRTLEVANNPDGDITNTSGVVVVLTAKIYL